MWKVPLFDLNYDNAESGAVQEVLNSKWLTMGEKTQTFENKFAGMLDDPTVQCNFVANCTSALYMSLLSLNLKSNDEVIIPALTFVADINAVTMAGAKAVLADSKSLTDWNISADTIKPLITDKTKALIVVHFAGFPCDMDPIVELCRQHNIFLIEDVAHAPDATYKGKKCGTIGDVGCFSFFTNKNLSTGEGGMTSTKNPDLHEKLKLLRSHGMSSLTLDRHKGRAITYDVIQPGLNFRSDEIHAALGLVQLKKLSDANEKRKKIFGYYRKYLNSVDGLSIPFNITNNTNPAYHIFPVLLDKDIDRVKVIQSLKEKGIQSSIHYPSAHQFSAYKHASLNPTPIADTISERELTLPLYPDLTTEMTELVVSSLKQSIKTSKK
jgi:dTDP-4-amino-4,6-dideoxygalactose transaminase